MSRKYVRKEVINLLEKERRANKPILLVGAGTGISAKFAERGGADLIATYNIAKYRMQGLGSMVGYLPIGDANQMTIDLAKRAIFPVVQETPVIAGVLGTDPTRKMDLYIAELSKQDFSGVLNCPTIALVDGIFRQSLEDVGVTYEREVEMMRIAMEKELFTLAFCTTPEQAKKMSDAEVDLVIAHMGNSIGGSIGAVKGVLSLEEAAKKTQRIVDVAREENPDIFTMVHGGPVAEPEDFQAILDNTTGVDGFFGGSSAERLPVEKAIQQTMETYKNYPIGG